MIDQSFNPDNTLISLFGQTPTLGTPAIANSTPRPPKCPKCAVTVRKDAANVVACIICNEIIHMACIAKSSKSAIVNEQTIMASLRNDSLLIYCCDRCRPAIGTRNSLESESLKTEITNLKSQVLELTRKIHSIQSAAPSKAKRQRTESANEDIYDIINDLVKPIIADEIASLKSSIQEIASIVKKSQPQAQPKTPIAHRRDPPHTSSVLNRDRTPTVPNARRNKKSRNVPEVNEELTKLTFAEVLNNNNEDRGRFVNVRVQDPEDVDTIKSIQAEQITKTIKINNVRSKSPNYLTVECQNETDALSLKASLNNKYADKVSIETSRPTTPLVKITNLPASIDENTILEEIIEYNYWLENTDIAIDRIYKINTGKRIYCNVIMKCDLTTQKSIIQKGAVMYGLKERFAFEYINLMQCARCQSFGHAANACKHPLRCKKCAGEHAVAECSSISVKCINCTNHNFKSDGPKFDAAHIASSDHCKCRTERINGLKSFHANKSKN